jgi:hypothetical protein
MKVVLGRKGYLLRDWVEMAMEIVELARSLLKTSFNTSLAAGRHGTGILAAQAVACQRVRQGVA